MHILVATDADWVLDEMRSALEEPGTTFTHCRDGREVTAAVAKRTPDIAILDLQVGSKGGMAITMDLRLDESGGQARTCRALMLLDRRADVHLAKRSAADGWLMKPLIRCGCGGPCRRSSPVAPSRRASPLRRSRKQIRGIS